jgi:Tyrosyl-DNA phosphodiesterase
MDGNVNCMHAKLALLAHPNYLRLLITSANLTPYDWGVTGCLENVRDSTIASEFAALTVATDRFAL